jgi:hypothetical protein
MSHPKNKTAKWLCLGCKQSGSWVGYREANWRKKKCIFLDHSRQYSYLDKLTINLFIMAYLRSNWAPTPIELSQKTTAEVWENAGKMRIPKGYLLAKNDDKFLYLAIDLVEDTTNDPGTGDYFWLTFDRNRNRVINPRQDVNYGLYPGDPNRMGRQYYLGPGRWTGLLNETTDSECRIAFEESPNSSTAHRVWKIRIEMADLGASLFPGLFRIPFTRFGLKVHSSAGGFDEETPDNFYRTFRFLHVLYFARKRRIPSSLLGPVIGSVGLIPTSDSIIGADGKATTAAGYSPRVLNAAFGKRLNFMGNRATIATAMAAGARRHKILYRKVGSSSWEPLLSSWSNYKWSGTTYTLEMTTFDTNDTYPLPNPAIDYSIDDLLIQFDSRELDNGLHEFKVQLYKSNGTTAVASPNQILRLFIDNSVPEVTINSIKHKGNNVDACAIVNLEDAKDGVVIDYGASDPEGNLRAYGLWAEWGAGNSRNIDYKSYQTSMGNVWTGDNSIQAPASGVWKPLETCAHAFAVRAWARTTNGYGYVGYNSYRQFITLIKP